MAKTMNCTGSWLVLGTGVGIAIGVALENVGVGLAIGAATGVAIGASFDRKESERRKNGVPQADGV